MAEKIDDQSEDIQPYADWASKPKGGESGQKVQADVPVGEVLGKANTLNLSAAIKQIAKQKRQPFGAD